MLYRLVYEDFLESFPRLSSILPPFPGLRHQMEGWRNLAQTQEGNQGNNQQLTAKYCQKLPRKSTSKLPENTNQKAAGKQFKLTIYPRKKAGASKGMVNKKQVFESDTDEGEEEHRDVVDESLMSKVQQVMKKRLILSQIKKPVTP